MQKPLGHSWLKQLMREVWQRWPLIDRIGTFKAYVK